MSQRTESSPVRIKRSFRFRQLFALAEHGDESAAGDLFREFGFRFGEDAP